MESHLVGKGELTLHGEREMAERQVEIGSTLLKILSGWRRDHEITHIYSWQLFGGGAQSAGKCGIPLCSESLMQPFMETYSSTKLHLLNNFGAFLCTIHEDWKTFRMASLFFTGWVSLQPILKIWLQFCKSFLFCNI